MWQYILKVGVTAIIVIAVTEIAKRSSVWGGLLASLPLVSLLAFIWIYFDTGDKQTIAALSVNIFWLVLASLPLFLVLPALLRSGWSFWPSLATASVATIAAYAALLWLLRQFQG